MMIGGIYDAKQRSELVLRAGSAELVEVARFGQKQRVRFRFAEIAG